MEMTNITPTAARTATIGPTVAPILLLLRVSLGDSVVLELVDMEAVGPVVGGGVVVAVYEETIFNISIHLQKGKFKLTRQSEGCKHSCSRWNNIY